MKTVNPSTDIVDVRKCIVCMEKINRGEAFFAIDQRGDGVKEHLQNYYDFHMDCYSGISPNFLLGLLSIPGDVTYY